MMNNNKSMNIHMGVLIDQLVCDDIALRQRARKSPVDIGKPAVPYLSRELQESPSDTLRWEAVNALNEIDDPKSIPALVAALTDSDTDTAWLRRLIPIRFLFFLAPSSAHPPSP